MGLLALALDALFLLSAAALARALPDLAAVVDYAGESVRRDVVVSGLFYGLFLVWLGGYRLEVLRAPLVAFPRILLALLAGVLAASLFGLVFDTPDPFPNSRPPWALRLDDFVARLGGAHLRAEALLSRGGAALLLVAGTVGVALAATGARFVLAAWLRRLARTGWLEQRFVVVGGGEGLAKVLAALQAARGQGWRLCGVFDERRFPRSAAPDPGPGRAGDLADLAAFCRRAEIDFILFAIAGLSIGRQLALIERLALVPLAIWAIEEQAPLVPEKAARLTLGGLRLVRLARPPISGWKAAQKRAFDLIFGGFLLALALPALAVIALAIKLDSPGPVFFRQKRHGFNNRPIEVWKFRTLYADRCDPTAVKAVARDDPRVTRVGRFLRKSSLDELPQLFNVLGGSLSLVGPRPHAVAARTGAMRYEEVVQTYAARHRVKPGITGWAQVNGWRGELDSPGKLRARVAHDLYYIENWSLWFDVKILLMTPWALVSGRNAY